MLRLIFCNRYYKIKWLLCAFSLVVDRDLLIGPPSQMAPIPHQITSADFVSFFMPQKSFNKPFEFLLYKTNRLHFSVCVYCNRSTVTRLRLVSYFFLLYTLWRHLCTRENVIYLLNRFLPKRSFKLIILLVTLHSNFLWHYIKITSFHHLFLCV